MTAYARTELGRHGMDSPAPSLSIKPLAPAPRRRVGARMATATLYARTGEMAVYDIANDARHVALLSR